MSDVSAKIIIKAINNASPIIKGISGDLRSMHSVAAAVAMSVGKDFVNGFIAANSELDRMRRAFDAIAGAGVGKIEYDRLTETANKLGLSLDSLTSSYTQLKAASIGTALEGKGAEDAFKSVAGAMSVLGANSQQTKMAFLAISQMVSKGTVSMEELRRQLAQHLPGALQIFARSLNVSVGELYKLVKAGKVGIPEMVKFFDQINKEYNPDKMKVSTYEQNAARLENAFKTLNVEIGATGVWQLLTDVMGASAKAVNSVAGSIRSDTVAMGAVWDSWGKQFSQIMSEADTALNGFLTDFKNNTAETQGIAYAIGETAKFIADAFKNLPINIKTSVVVLMSEIGQALITIRSQFETLWAYLGASADGAIAGVRVSFQSVVTEINGLLANMAGSMANSLQALGKDAQFIPGFRASVNGIAAGLRSMETAAQDSAKRLQELKTAQDDVGRGYEQRKARIEATAAAERGAWADTAAAALKARDVQMQATNDLIRQRVDSADWDKQEQALWGRRVENLKAATVAVADQGKIGKATANIMKELSSIGRETTGRQSSAASELDATLALVRVQKLRNQLSASSSEEAKQAYLDALKEADAAAKALKTDQERASALSLLAAEKQRLQESGIIPNDDATAVIDADTTPASEKLKILREEINGIPSFQQIDADTESAYSKISELIQWANSQSATIRVNTITNSAPSTPDAPTGEGFARGGYVNGIGNRDTVSAMLTPGEFVLTKQAVNRLGIPYLAALNGNRAINRLDIPRASHHYASGGLVGSTVNHVVELRLPTGNSHRVSVTSHEAVRRLADDMTKLGRAV